MILTSKIEHTSCIMVLTCKYMNLLCSNTSVLLSPGSNDYSRSSPFIEIKTRFLFTEVSLSLWDPRWVFTSLQEHWWVFTSMSLSAWLMSFIESTYGCPNCLQNRCRQKEIRPYLCSQLPKILAMKKHDFDNHSNHELGKIRTSTKPDCIDDRKLLS